MPAVRLIESHSELAKLAAEWDRLHALQNQPWPFTTLDWLLAFERWRETSPLHVLTAWEGTELVGAAPLVLGRDRQGGLTGPNLAGLEDVHAQSYAWLLPPDREAAVAVAGAILAEAGRLQPRRLTFSWNNAYPDSTAHQAVVEALQRAGFLVSLRPRRFAPILALPGGKRKYLSTLAKGFRKNLRNYNNKLKKLGPLGFEPVTEPELLPDLLAESWELEKATWKGRAGTAVGNDPALTSFYNEVALTMAAQGRMVLLQTRLDGRLLAFEYGLLDSQTLHLVKGSFDPEYEWASPGHLSIMNCVDWAEKSGLLRVSLGGEAEDWKLRWTKQVQEVVEVRAFPPGPTGRYLHAVKFGWKDLIKRLPGGDRLARRSIPEGVTRPGRGPGGLEPLEIADPRQPTPCLTVRELRNPSGLNEIRKAWEKLNRAQPRPRAFTEPVWFKTFLLAMDLGRLEPCLVTVWDNNRMVAAAPLLAPPGDEPEGRAGPLLKGLENVHTQAYGWLVDPDETLGRLAIRAILGHLERSLGRQPRFAWGNSYREAPTIPLILSEFTARGYLISRRPRRSSPLIQLPGEGRSLYSTLSKNTRRRLTKARNRLAKIGPLKIEIVTDRERLPELLDLAWRIEASTWKGRVGTSVAQDEMTRAFYDKLALELTARDRMHLTLLWVGETLVAFAYTLVEDGLAHVLKISFDEKYARTWPGHQVIRAEIEWAEEQGLTAVSLGGEEEAWKHHWTSVLENIEAIFIFPAGWRGRAAYWSAFGWKDLMKKIPWAVEYKSARDRRRLEALRRGGR